VPRTHQQSPSRILIFAVEVESDQVAPTIGEYFDVVNQHWNWLDARFAGAWDATNPEPLADAVRSILSDRSIVSDDQKGARYCARCGDRNRQGDVPILAYCQQCGEVTEHSTRANGAPDVDVEAK